jgi:uncharacterized protein (TIGR02271 family)
MSGRLPISHHQTTTNHRRPSTIDWSNAVSWLSRLEPGMKVFASDGHLGSIASVPRVDLNDPSAPAEVIVLASQENAGPGVEEFRRVTRDMVERVEGRNLYLNLPRHQVPRASGSVAAAHRQLRTSGEHLRIPLVEEEIAIDKRVVELGYVQVQKRVEERIDEREVELRHQQVDVERVPIDQVIPEMITPYMDGDVYVVPVIEEEVIVTRQLRLKEELRIRRTAATHRETIRTPYRREEVSINEHWFEKERGADGVANPDEVNENA